MAAIWNHIGWNIILEVNNTHFPVDLSRCLWCDLKTFFKGWFPRCFVFLNTFLMFIYLDVLFLPLPCLCTGGYWLHQCQSVALIKIQALFMAWKLTHCAFFHLFPGVWLQMLQSRWKRTSNSSKLTRSSCRLVGKALQRDQRDADLVQGAAGATGKLQELESLVSVGQLKQ